MESMEALLLGIAVGFFAGIIPGAFSTVVATTALERGMGAGVKVALIPVVTESLVMLASALVLTRLPDSTLRWIGIAGGILLLIIAVKVLVGAEKRRAVIQESEGSRGHFLRVALFGVISPGPWAFWFFVGAPLLLNRWFAHPSQGVAFFLGFMGCFIGVMVALAWAVASGRKFLNLLWYRRILRGAGALLVLLGLGLLWQSWVGNFSALVSGPEEVERRINGL
ncbi:MAG: hypothetical protein EA352_03520 [Gemmatimonadales bacterium]|nr:MAG: hypothetical protein EA352_03520 [Gemmatimonadales bacterium]